MSKVISVSVSDEMYNWIMNLDMEERKVLWKELRNKIRDIKEGRIELTEQERTEILADLERWCRERWGEKKEV